MAKLVVVTRSFADIARGDISSVYNDEEDEGRDVRNTDLFRVLRVPGDKSLYEHLAKWEPQVDIDKEYPFRAKRVDLDIIETAEVSKLGKPLAIADEVTLRAKEELDVLVIDKPVRRLGVVLPPEEEKAI